MSKRKITRNLYDIKDDKDTNLLPENIRKDVEILGITGELDPLRDESDATATASDIALNKSAYVDNTKIYGTVMTTDDGLDTLETTITDPNVTYSQGKINIESPITTNQHMLLRQNSQVYVEGSINQSIIANKANITGDKIIEGNTILGVEGTYEPLDTADATATADDLINPKTAYVDGEKITGSIQVNEVPREASLYNNEYISVPAFKNNNAFYISRDEKYVYLLTSSSVVIRNIQTNTNVAEINLSLNNIPTDYEKIAVSPIKDNKIYILLAKSSGDIVTYFLFNMSSTTVERVKSLSLGVSPSSSYKSSSIYSFNTKFGRFVYTNRYGENASPYVFVINTIDDEKTYVGLLGDWNVGHQLLDSKDRYFISCCSDGSYENFIWFDENGDYTGKTQPFGTRNYFYPFYDGDHFYKPSEGKYYDAIIDTTNRTITLSTAHNMDIYNLPTSSSSWEYQVYCGAANEKIASIYNGSYTTYTSVGNLSNTTAMEGFARSSFFDNGNRWYLGDAANGRLYLYGIKTNGSKIETVYIKGTTIYNTEDSDVSNSDILNNKIAFGQNGKITGTMPNNGALNYTPTTNVQNIPAGYTTGGTINAVTSSIDVNITAENIKAGVNILGVTGNVIESAVTNLDVTLTTNNQSITPTSPYNGFNVVNIPAVTSSIDPNITTENIKSGVTILGVNGKNTVVDTEDANATRNEIMSTSTAYVNGEKVFGRIVPQYDADTPEQRSYTRFDSMIMEDMNLDYGLGIKAINENQLGIYSLSKNSDVPMQGPQLIATVDNFTGYRFYGNMARFARGLVYIGEDAGLRFYTGALDSNNYFHVVAAVINLRTHEITNKAHIDLNLATNHTRIPALTNPIIECIPGTPDRCVVAMHNLVLKSNSTYDVYNHLYMFHFYGDSGAYAVIGSVASGFSNSSTSGFSAISSNEDVAFSANARICSYKSSTSCVQGSTTTGKVNSIIVYSTDNWASYTVKRQTTSTAYSVLAFPVDNNNFVNTSNNIIDGSTLTTIGKIPFTPNISCRIVVIGKYLFYRVTPTASSITIYKRTDLSGVNDNWYEQYGTINDVSTASMIRHFEYDMAYLSNNYWESYRSLAGINGDIISLERNGVVYRKTEDTTAVASNILSGKTAYNSTGKISGTMANKGAVTIGVQESTDTTEGAGYYSSVKTLALEKDSSYRNAQKLAGLILEGVTLPSDYEQLEYLEGTGTQYIQLNFPETNTRIPDGNYDVLLDAQFTEFDARGSNNHYHLEGIGSGGGGTISNYKMMLYIGWHEDRGVWEFSNADRDDIETNTQADLNRHKFKIRSTTTSSTGGLYIDDNLIEANAAQSSSCKYVYRYYLFGYENSGGVWCNKIRIYRCTIGYTLTDPQVDLIPARRKSDGVLGMYDIIRNQFFTNAGTGTFLYGEF